MNLRRYHLAVVGAGSAGLASAALAAELGARVALIERRRLGGDRLRYGVPGAAVARAAHGGSSGADFAAAMDRARRLRSAAVAAADPARLRQLGVDVFFGEGRFVAGDAVEVDGRRLRFRRAVIATGARMGVPRRPGLEDVAYRTPETLFELETLPRRLGVLGGGSRGCEMAQAFAAFGSRVHLFAPGERILPGRDADAAAIVAEAMRRDGVEIHLRSEIQEIRQRDAFTVLAEGAPGLACDELLLAAGPTPNVEGLGLEAAGVEYDLSGVEVDRRLRTTNRAIFAAGGVASPPGLAPDADARMAVRNALLFRRLERRRRTVPRATYTCPQIARVGIDAEEAAESPSRVETLTLPLADADRAGLFGDQGFLRLHLQRRGRLALGGLPFGGTILGGTMVASRAAELIAPLAMAVSRRMRIGAFAEIPLPHPTQSEIYRRAAFAWRRQGGPARDLLALWFKLTSWL